MNWRQPTLIFYLIALLLAIMTRKAISFFFSSLLCDTFTSRFIESQWIFMYSFNQQHFFSLPLCSVTYRYKIVACFPTFMSIDALKLIIILLFDTPHKNYIYPHNSGSSIGKGSTTVQFFIFFFSTPSTFIVVVNIYGW